MGWSSKTGLFQNGKITDLGFCEGFVRFGCGLVLYWELFVVRNMHKLRFLLMNGYLAKSSSLALDVIM